MNGEDRKHDYAKDTDNGKKLKEFGYELADVLQAGWYALMERKEQNERNKLVRNLIKKDARFKDIVSQAKKQIGKK